MPRIVMMSSFETGHAVIDEDHRSIIEQINDIYESIAAGDNAHCRVLFDAFIAFCREHFEREEAFLVEAGFPRAREHASYHRDLLIRAAKVKEMCAGLDGSVCLETCFDELASFLVDDIVRGDSDFVSYLNEVGEAER